jgi:hypothetical protein
MYIFISISFLILISSLIPPNTLLKNRYISSAITFILIALMVVYIPTWNVYVSDMVRYIDAFETMQLLSLKQVFNMYDWEPLFLITQWILSKLFDNRDFFVISVFLFYIFILIKAVKKIFLPWHSMFVVFLFLCYPFFYGYIFNGIRQGIAMVILLLALGYWLKKPHSLKFYILIIIAGLFHYSSFIFSTVLLVVLMFNLRLRTLLLIWFGSLVLFMTGLNDLILNFSFIADIEYIEGYTNNEVTEYFGGANNLAYILLSVISLLVSLYFFRNIQLDEKHKEVYLVIIKCYTAFNSVFLLLGFIAYGNRLASFSWFIVPILIIYPILHKKIYSTFWLFLIVFCFFIIGMINSPFIVYK